MNNKESLQSAMLDPPHLWSDPRPDEEASKELFAGLDCIADDFQRQNQAIQDIRAEQAENNRRMKLQTEELRRIADAAEQRAALAKAEAESAKKDARFAKMISVISLAIALLDLLSSFAG